MANSNKSFVFHISFVGCLTCWYLYGVSVSGFQRTSWAKLRCLLFKHLFCNDPDIPSGTTHYANQSQRFMTIGFSYESTWFMLTYLFWIIVSDIDSPWLAIYFTFCCFELGMIIVIFWNEGRQSWSTKTSQHAFSKVSPLNHGLYNIWQKAPLTCNDKKWQNLNYYHIPRRVTWDKH